MPDSQRACNGVGVVSDEHELEGKLVGIERCEMFFCLSTNRRLVLIYCKRFPQHLDNNLQLKKHGANNWTSRPLRHSEPKRWRRPKDGWIPRQI